MTLDEVDKMNPVKAYPAKQAWGTYLRVVSQKMVETPLLAIVKHRRLMITWTACGIATWDAMFREGRNIAIVSKKEEDSDALVQRCKFIVENIPKGAVPVLPKWNYKYTELSFPEIDSKIKGYPQGADQLRQYTFSRVFLDEIAFWPQGRASFVSLKPTVEGGGQICMFSTRYPGFFQQVIEDKLDET